MNTDIAANKIARTKYEIHPLIKKRWSPRAFSEVQIDRDLLRQLFDAARWAPSSFNEQPWRYIVVRKGEPAFADAVAGLVEANQTWAASAPVLGFSLARSNFSRNDKPNRHAWHDLGAASAQLAIQAASIGLMIHQMAGIQP